jgi:hypothetical protein
LVVDQLAAAVGEGQKRLKLTFFETGLSDFQPLELDPVGTDVRKVVLRLLREPALGTAAEGLHSGNRHNQSPARRRLQSGKRPASLREPLPAQKPLNAPLSGCNRKPGISISATVQAASSLAKISRSLTACSAVTSRRVVVFMKAFQPLVAYRPDHPEP